MARKSGRTATAIAGLSFGLALGIGAGMYVLAPNVAGGPNQTTSTLERERDDALGSAQIAKAQAKSADSVVSALGRGITTDLLKEKKVLVFRTSDSLDSDADALSEALKSAGAENAGTIKLGEKFFTQEGADGLKNIIATTLPAGAQLSTEKMDSGTHAGDALGSALLLNKDDGSEQANKEDRGIVLGALRESGYIDFDEASVKPAHAIVLLSGDSDGSKAAFSIKNQVSFATALKSKGSGLLVAGRIHTASDAGLLGTIRTSAQDKQAVSTIDSIDQNWAQIAAILALKEQIDGKSGAYGAAGNVDATSPGIKNPE
ncbi:copper transporter [Corynebacterium diphtheriae]|nr:copper transporter [Corynebacterium diphtheriae]